MTNLTREDLRIMLENPDNNIAANIMYYGVRLRGTRAYWRQRCSELTQMIRQLNMPSVFFTLSAADYHWPDLYRLLRPGIEVEQLSERERALLMHNNPATVSLFFERRVDIFIKKFLIPFFNVPLEPKPMCYWFRFELRHTLP